METSGDSNASRHNSSSEESRIRTDRDKYGLRGSVNVCEEETAYLPSTDITSKNSEKKALRRMEFNREGRIVAITSHNFDGSTWAEDYIYNSSGQLLKSIRGKEGEQALAIVNSYDDFGRILSTRSNRPKDTVLYNYDESGRKTKTQVSQPEDYVANCSAAGSPFTVADRAPNLPGGGSATTFYDEHDRPIEVEIRDSSGELVSKTIRKYDRQGRVIEEKQVLDDPVAIIPQELRGRLLETTNTPIDELRDQVTRLMADQEALHSIAFTYDLEGHVVHTIRRVFGYEEIIDATYNEHGDVATEITLSKSLNGEKQKSEQTQSSQTRYSYEYDHNGNWVERTISYHTAQDGEFKESVRTIRTLTYF